MDAEALCTCGCPYRRHRPEIARGAVVLACFRHDSCEGFTADVPTEVAAMDGGANDEPATVAATPLLVDDHTGDVYWPTDPAAPSTLIRAWTAYRCERCEGMAWDLEPVCHGRPMVPVRVEVHSRESP